MDKEEGERFIRRREEAKVYRRRIREAQARGDQKRVDELTEQYMQLLREE